MTAIPVHHTATSDGPWDAGEVRRNLPGDQKRWLTVFAYYDQTADDNDEDGLPDAKDAWAFPHHDRAGGPANVNGCSAALGRLANWNGPKADAPGIRRHIQAHLDDSRTLIPKEQSVDPDENNLLIPLRSEETVTRAHALVVPGGERTPAAEAIDAIRALGLGTVEPQDVFTFHMVAASDGVDSYWTQQDLKSSLRPMATDLIRGQSVLGNHDYGTFSYGSSFGANVVKAKADDPLYEQTFWRGVKDERLHTKNLLVGDYFITRGIRLNGEETDSIIRGLETGAIRKASISFTVGRYVCGLDGLEMTAAGWAMLSASARHGAEDAATAEECKHFPGVVYPDGTAWAVMEGDQLLETSLVYKNSSPSALLMARAVEMARAGLLNSAQAAQVEERYQMRLPRHNPGLWRGVGVLPATKEVRMTKRHDVDENGEEIVAEFDLEDEGPIVGQPAEEPEPVGEPEGEPEPVEALVTAFVSAAGAITGAIGAGALRSDQLEVVFGLERSLDEALGDKWNNSVGRVAQRTFELRDAALSDALGSAPTAEAIRSLKAKADVGDRLIKDLINDVVAARVGVGVTFDEAAYREVLGNAGSVDFLRSELQTWTELKRARFLPGRKVDATEPPAAKPAKRTAPAKAEEAEDDNILAPRAKK